MPAHQVPFFTLGLLVQLALLGLALVHARTGALPTLTLWATRLLIASSLVVSPVVAYEAAWEITTYDYPWTLPGRPFGTYEQPTVLGVGLVAVHALLFIVVGVSAFVRPRIASGILAFIAITGTASALLWLSDPSAPELNWAAALVVGPPLPALTTAYLLRSLTRPLTGS